MTPQNPQSAQPAQPTPTNDANAITEIVQAGVRQVVSPLQERLDSLEQFRAAQEQIDRTARSGDGLSEQRRASVLAAVRSGQVIGAHGEAVRSGPSSFTQALVATEQPAVVEGMAAFIRTLGYQRSQNVSFEAALSWYEGHHGNREAAQFTRALGDRLFGTRTLNTTTTGSGGALIPLELMLSQFEGLLYAARPLAALGVRRVGFNNGRARIPRMIGGSSPSFNAEGRPIPVSEPKFGFIDLAAKDLDALIAVTNDLLLDTSYGASVFIVADLVQQMAIKLDSTALWADGSNGQILGLYYTPGVQKITATTGSKSMQNDLTAVLSAYAESNSRNNRPGWLMHPATARRINDTTSTTGQFIFDEQMGRGMLRGQPFQVSTIVPYAPNKTLLAFGDWNEFVLGVSQDLVITTSTDGTVVMPDNSVVSAFQSKLTLMRATQRNDAAVMQPGVFVILEAIDLATWKWL